MAQHTPTFSSSVSRINIASIPVILCIDVPTQLARNEDINPKIQPKKHIIHSQLRSPV
jgi:hypothetical protein